MTEVDNAQSQTITLKSADDEKFQVERDVIKLSKIISTMLEDLCGEATDEESSETLFTVPIPLQNVNAEILNMVIDWCRHHKDDPPFVVDENADRTVTKPSDDIPEWDRNFLNIDRAKLFDLILAANFLDIPGLLDVTCKTIANMLKGKTAEQMREILDIENDLTPEEIEQIRRENAWCED